MSPEPSQRETSSFEEAVRAASDQVRESQAAREVETAPRPPLLTRPPVIGTVAVAFLGVIVWNIMVFLEPPIAPTPQEEAQVLPAGLFAGTQAVEAFRQETGRLPSSAEEAGLPAGTFQFRSAGDEYVLTALGQARSVEHRSSDGLPAVIEGMAEAYRGGAQ